MVLPIMTGNYRTGKGRAYFKKAGTNVWERLGNLRSLSISRNIETAEEYSNETATRTLAHTETIEATYQLSFTAVQFTDRVRSLSMASDIAYLTQSAGSAVTQAITGGGAVGIYKLDHHDVTVTAVTDGEGSPTAYTLGTHYRLDSDLGLIEVVAVPDGAGENLSVTYDHAAVVAGDGRVNLGLGKDTDLAGAFYFRGVAASGDKPSVLFLPNIQLRATGERSYITSGQELLSIDLTADILAGNGQAAGYELGAEFDLAAVT